jgi:hypothetical protein
LFAVVACGALLAIASAHAARHVHSTQRADLAEVGQADGLS